MALGSCGWMHNPEDYVPNIETDIVRHTEDHEIFLEFISDDHAIVFHDWWHLEGAKSFVEWIKNAKQEE